MTQIEPYRPRLCWPCCFVSSRRGNGLNRIAVATHVLNFTTSAVIGRWKGRGNAENLPCANADATNSINWKRKSIRPTLGVSLERIANRLDAFVRRPVGKDKMHFAGFHMEKRDKYKTDAELTGDVMYYVWRRGGNPDRVRQDQVARMRQEDNGEFADAIADRMIANDK